MRRAKKRKTPENLKYDMNRVFCINEIVNGILYRTRENKIRKAFVV